MIVVSCRVLMLLRYFESKYLIHGAWFGSSHLVSDIGLIAEVYFQFGFLEL